MTRTVRLRATSIDYGQPGLVLINAVDEDPANYINTSTGGSPLAEVAPVAGLPGSTKLILMDSVTLRDADDGAGFYAAASGFNSNWPGCVVSRSGDGGASFTDIESILGESIIGYANTALATAARPNDWDTVNTVDVQLLKPSIFALTSDTDINVLNGANVGALIDSTGQVEIFQWTTATPSGGGVYTLSRLLRGRKGSDYAMAAHGMGDVFVVIDSAKLRRITADAAQLYLSRLYKATTIGTFLEDAAGVIFTNNGASLKPLSPVLGAAARDGSSNLTVAFIRRTRISGDWADYVDVPLGEASEAYECDIYTSGAFTTVKRTLTGTATAAGSKIDAATHIITYKAADQVTDFGSNQATVFLKAYQLSVTVGRGFAATGTV